LKEGLARTIQYFDQLLTHIPQVGIR
jgi:hypothetical protein